MKQSDQVQETGAEELAGDAEGRLSRWSRRKQASRVEQNATHSPVVAAAMENEAEEQLLQHLTDEDMPPLETLSEESDYTGFLSPKVSDELRKLALRKLFHCSRFNICDGLDDYDEDFTKFAKLGDVITADMRHLAEMEALKKMQQQEGVEPQMVEEEAASEQQERVTASIDEEPALMEEMLSVEDDMEDSMEDGADSEFTFEHERVI